MQSREQVLFPLLLTNTVDNVDVEAVVTGGGYSTQSFAIRYGISMALRSFLDTETIETMRLAGLLTRDFRRRERKKPGQEGPRRRYTWKRR